MSSSYKPHWLFYCFSLVFLFVVDVESKPPRDVNAFLFSGAFDFRDLSHPFTNETLCSPASNAVTFSKNSGSTRIDGVWFDEESDCKSLYTGTRIDAPYFNNTSWSVGSIPFENLISPLIIVDLNNYVAGNEDFVLERRHMDYLFHGDLRRNFVVLFRFGWSQHFGNKEKYYGGSSPSTYKYPGLSKDVAEWISLNKNLIGVAVDTPSVDPGSVAQIGAARKVFIEKQIFMVENINIGLDLPRTQCAVIIMPIKFQDGTDAPCRVTSICPKVHL